MRTTRPRKLISEHELRMIVLNAFVVGANLQSKSKGYVVGELSLDDMVRATAENMAAYAISGELDITSEIERMCRAKYRAAA